MEVVQAGTTPEGFSVFLDRHASEADHIGVVARIKPHTSYHGPIESGLARVTPSMERAARTLGETENGALARVHAPLAKGAVWTAAILVFLDVLKELPATLILRPFNFDTLAVLADRYAADEWLAQAAWPALIIVAVAVIRRWNVAR